MAAARRTVDAIRNHHDTTCSVCAHYGPSECDAAILLSALADAEQSEAALGRVRALCGQPGVRGAVWTADIRAAIDPEATP